jgi:hypothetical protein
MPALLRALLATTLASVVGAVACSLSTIPDLTSGTGATDGGRTDATDGASGDGGTEGAAAPFCASLGRQAAVCDDFDGDPDLLTRWSVVRSFDGAFGVTLDSSLAYSKPRSLLARVMPAAPSCAYATVQRDVTGSFNGSRLEYRVQFSSASDLPGKSTISAQSFGPGTALCQVFLTATTTTLSLGEQIIHADGGREEIDSDVKPALRLGAWNHVVVDYDLPKKKITVTLDDLPPRVFDAKLVCPYAPGNVSANVGLFCEPTGPTARRAHFDDVVLDVR